MSRTSRPESILTFAKPSWWIECTGPLIPMSPSPMTPKTKVIHLLHFPLLIFPFRVQRCWDRCHRQQRHGQRGGCGQRGGSLRFARGSFHPAGPGHRRHQVRGRLRPSNHYHRLSEPPSQSSQHAMPKSTQSRSLRFVFLCIVATKCTKLQDSFLNVFFSFSK